jgi:hypothetical protein
MLKWLRASQSSPTGAPPAGGSGQRQAPRHDAQIEIWLRRRGLAPNAAMVMNISRSGAAIRIHGWNVPVPSPWPTRLKHGDEVWLVGLLSAPISCWVVTVDDGVLRVRFELDDQMREQLHTLIESLPA